MKKSTFIHLVAGTIGGLLFSIGICMCLLPEWNAFRLGVGCAGVGGAMLLVQSVVAWLQSGRKIRFSWKLAVRVLFGMLGAATLGLGMCMVLVWDMMLAGIVVGIGGIVLLLLLIPMCIGFK